MNVRQQVVLASTNSNKLREFQQLLENTQIEIVAPASSLPVDENALTYLGNAQKKARVWAKALGRPCLADDTGLEVEALGGRPGILSARYANSDPERIAKLLGELAGTQNRRACFVCAICLAWPDLREISVIGEAAGEICLEPQGAAGFGFDPIFWEPQLRVSYAAMTYQQKNARSHRAMAVRSLLDELSRLGRLRE